MGKALGEEESWPSLFPQYVEIAGAMGEIGGQKAAGRGGGFLGRWRDAGCHLSPGQGSPSGGRRAEQFGYGQGVEGMARRDGAACWQPGIRLGRGTKESQANPLNLNTPAAPSATPEDAPAPARAPNPPKGCGNGGREGGWDLAMGLLNEQKKSLQTR